MNTRRGFLLLMVASPLSLAACSSGSADTAEDERPLTTDESQALAVTRFRLYQRGTVPVRMVWPTAPAVTIDATLDLVKHLGYGVLESDQKPAGRRLIGWNQQALTTAPYDGAAVPPPEGWTNRVMSTDVAQDLFLSLALSLGSDRPENPVLLEQGSARFLRTDKVGDTKVSVFTGPRPAGDTSTSRTRYWIDSAGDLERFESYLGDSHGRLAQIDLVAKSSAPTGLRPAVEHALTGVGAPGVQ